MIKFKKYFFKIVVVIFLILIISKTFIFSGKIMTVPELKITSNSFKDNSDIPVKYTCDGENISPQLSWNSLKTAKSYILIVDDPDAKKVIGRTFIHWIVQVPPSITSLPEAISGKNGSSLKVLDKDAFELITDYKKELYMGPCPPENTGEHIYRFNLFALSKFLTKEDLLKNLKTPFAAEDFKQKMEKYIIVQAVITGKYSR